MTADFFGEFRNRIIGSYSVTDACQTALRFLVTELPFPAGAILLLDKHGLLQCEALCGVDRDGREIRPGPWVGERYNPQAWLFARFFGPDASARPYVSRRPECPDLPRAYQTIAGPNPTLLAVPISGANHSYGVVLLFNGPPLADLMVTYTLILSTALSTIRARNEIGLIARITRRLVEIDRDEAGALPACVFESLLSPLVRPNEIFKAVVVRIEDVNGDYAEQGKFGDGVDWRHWKDTPIGPDEICLSGMALHQKQAVTVPDVRSQVDLFRSREWVLDNHIKSAASFPLCCGPRTLGALTVYTAFPYEFPIRTRDAFSHIANAIVMRIVRSLFRGAEAELAAQQNRSLLDVCRYQADHRLYTLAHNQAHFLTGLVNDIDDLIASRGDPARRLRAMQAGIQAQRRVVVDSVAPPSRQSVDVAAVTATVVETYRQACRLEGIQFETDIATDLRLRLEQGLIEALLTSLLDNACDAVRSARRADGLISVRVAESTLAGRRLEICVQDNGMGMPAEDLSRAGDLRFTTREQGNGLGLPIVRSIAEQFGGSIQAHSQPNCGTRVSAWLDLSRIPIDPRSTS